MNSKQYINDIAFQTEIHLWNQISAKYPDICVEYSCDNYKEWHITISKYDHFNRYYKFHFIAIWNDFSRCTPPTICLIFDQRRMVHMHSSNLFNNQCLILDQTNHTFTAQHVLLEMRSIVQRIKLQDGIDPDTFNQCCCGYCPFGQFNFVNNGTNPYFFPNNNPKHTTIKPKKESKDPDFSSLKGILNEKEQRKLIGEKLLPKVRQYGKNKCGKVLGILLTELKIETLFKLLNNEQLLNDTIMETLELLSKFKDLQMKNNDQPKNVKPRQQQQQQKPKDEHHKPQISYSGIIHQYFSSKVCFSTKGNNHIHYTNVDMNGNVYYLAIGKKGQFELRKFEQQSHH